MTTYYQCDVCLKQTKFADRVIDVKGDLRHLFDKSSCYVTAICESCYTLLRIVVTNWVESQGPEPEDS